VVARAVGSQPQPPAVRAWPQSKSAGSASSPGPTRDRNGWRNAARHRHREQRRRLVVVAEDEEALEQPRRNLTMIETRKLPVKLTPEESRAHRARAQRHVLEARSLIENRKRAALSDFRHERKPHVEDRDMLELLKDDRRRDA
jgi:hypothetical protein